MKLRYTLPIVLVLVLSACGGRVTTPQESTVAEQVTEGDDLALLNVNRGPMITFKRIAP